MNRVLSIVCLLIAAAAGCMPQGSSEKLGEVSRLNELSFRNDSGRKLSKVDVEWAGEDFTITNEHQALERGRYVRKLAIRKKQETTFKITVHFADGKTAVHEERVALDPKERQLIAVELERDLKFSVRKKQRNPHILPPN